MPADTDKYLEPTAAALSLAWLDLRQSDEEAATAAASLLQAHEGTSGQVRLTALSQAFESLRILLVKDQKPEVLELTEQRLQAVRQAGWRRAELLAEAAWARARMYYPQEHAAALALARTHERRGNGHDAELDDRPAVERVWSDLALCLLYASVEDFPKALDCGLRAELDAQQTDHDLVHAQVAQIVAYAYLCVGDVEGACAVLPRGMAASARIVPWGVGLAYNWLLALILSQRFDQAADLLRTYPHVSGAAALSRLPSLAALVARVRFAEGRRTEAKMLLPGGLLESDDPFHMLSNGIWASADVLVGFGRAAEARQLVHRGLVVLRAKGAALSPMNGSQIYRALADACEADGDPAAALAALRQSQAYCYTWLSKSMEARLQALHFHPVGAGLQTTRQTQAQRVRVVQEALDRARQTSTQAHDGRASAPFKLLLATADTEMRKPVDGVLGMTSLLMMSELEERQRLYQQAPLESADQLLTLCNNVLDLARLDADTFELQAEPVALADLVARSAQLLAPRAKARGVTLRCQVDPTLPHWVLMDRARLQQVLTHLLANAVQHTTHGHITVALEHLDRPDPARPAAALRMRLSVQDTGSGIPPQALPRLFEEFSPGATPPSEAPGAGLGLALSRRVVLAMGGEMGVHSAPGQGSTFWCVLPLQATAAPTGATAGKRSAGVGV